MADDLVKFMLDEVASDGGQGTTITRFIHLFSQPHSPAFQGRPVASASDISDVKSKGSNNARPILSPAEEQALEKHAAYVWRSMCTIEGIHVYRLTGAKKKHAANITKETPRANLASERIQPHEDDLNQEEEEEEPLVAIDEAMMTDPELMDVSAARTPALRETGKGDSAAGIVSVEDGAGDMLHLRETYGNKVVMRASDKNILFALTGDPSRSSRYAALQEETCEAIARSRGRGISMIQITNQVKAVGGDAKKAHYAVKILGRLGLVIKLRTTEHKTSTSLMIHRKYADLNKQLQIRKELLAQGIEHDPASGDGEQEDAPINDAMGMPQFEPFGREHLKLYGFVVGRLTRLLRCNLWHHLLQYHRVLDTLGFEHTPTKADRRLFTKHVRRMRNEGIIEVVAVPGAGGGTTRCLRLTEFRPQGGETFEVDNPYARSSGANKGDATAEEDAEDLDAVINAADEPELHPLALPFNTVQTLDYQMLNQVRLSGGQGTLIADIVDRLAKIERKTVEHTLARYEDTGQVPANLQDYALFSMAVTMGKERRTLYLTIAGLREKCASEDLPIPKGLAEVSESVGDVCEIRADRLFSTKEEYHALLDRLSRSDERLVKPDRPKKKLGRPRKPREAAVEVSADEDEDEDAGDDSDVGPRGRPRKYVRLVDLRGQLIRRRKYLDVKREPTFPACFLYNEMTGVYFNAPEGYKGFGPVSETPVAWDTAKKSRVVDIEGKPISVPKPPSANKLAKWRARAAEELGAAAELPMAALDDEPAAPPRKKQKTGRKKKKKARAGTDVGSLDEEAEHADESVAPDPFMDDTIDPALMEMDGLMSTEAPPPAVPPPEPPVEAPSQQAPVQVEAVAGPSTRTKARAQRSRRRQSSPAPSPAPAAKKSRKNDESTQVAQSSITGGRIAGVAADARTPAAGPFQNDDFEVAEVVAPPTSGNGVRTTPAGKESVPKRRPSGAMPQRFNANNLIRQRDTEACLRAVGGIALRDASFLVILENWYAQQVAAGLKKASEVPGKSDRRTVDRSIESLITEGKVRGIHVSTGDAMDKVIRLIVLTDIQPAAIQTWVKNYRRGSGMLQAYDVVQRQGPGAATDAPAGDAARFTRIHQSTRRVKIPKDEAMRAFHTPGEILDQLPTEECRDLFLKDWRIIPQTYGLIPGRFRRAETLHMALVSYLETNSSPQRLVPIDWIFQGMSIGTFCTCFPVTILDKDLSTLCNDAMTSATPLRECSPELLRSVGISKRPIRKKVMDVIHTLVKLGIARLADDHGASLAEDRLEDASYIELARAVAVRNYSQTDPGCPTATVRPVENTRHAVDYWYTLWYIASSRSDTERAKIEELAGQAHDLHATFAEFPAEDETFKAQIIKPSSWQQNYQLTSAQRKYISWKVHSRPMDSHPLGASNTAIIDLAMRVFAPYDVVQKQVARLERVRMRACRNEERLSVPEDRKRKTKRAAEQVRQALAEKLRQRQEALENQWNMLHHSALSQVPVEGGKELDTYLAPIRKEFMRNAGSFNPRKVVLALESFKIRKEQGVQREARARKAIKISTGNATSGLRTRTTWTAEADEMARDAYAVMQSRLRRLPNVKANQRQFDALSQLWPELEPKRVVDRVRRWLKEREAHAAYFDRLCMAWEKQVKTHRGDPGLPDPNPESLNDFDLLSHVLFLRQNVKKGILLRNVGEIRDEDRLPPLPASVDEIDRTATVAPLRPGQASEGFRLFWGRDGEQTTEDILNRTTALKLEARSVRDAGQNFTDDQFAVARSAVKMLLSKKLVEEQTPSFDAAAAQNLLKQIPSDVAKRGLDSLRRKAWVTERPQAHATPGSGFEYSNMYKNRLCEPLALEVLDQADALIQDLGGEAQTYDWPLTCTSGEFASLMTLVAHDKVNFEIDVEPCFRMFAAKGEYSTKAIDDPDEEVALRFSAKPLDSASQGDVPEQMSGNERELVTEAVQSRGSEGATLRDICDDASLAIKDALLAGSQVLRDPSSSVGAAGYAANRLVDTNVDERWRLLCTKKDGGSERIAPRQWLDENGGKVTEVWEQCVAKLYGTIVQRPGVSETTLREIVKGILDRQEINDIINYLLDRAIIKRIVPESLGLPELNTIAAGIADLDIEDLVQYACVTEWSVLGQDADEIGASEA